METKLNYEKKIEKPPVDAPLINCSGRESINSTDLDNLRNTQDNPMSSFHRGSGNNLDSNIKRSISSKRVFVLDVEGNPLTPCKPSKAKKLLKGKQAKTCWNKFGEFGIQMLVDTNNKTPKMVLGVDSGTKFEGYSVVSEKDNNSNIMWLLPDKKVIVRKLDERRRLRRARRFRNCRRRKPRFDNRSREGFIAPSQLVLVQSRLKAIQEFFKTYPISKVAFENVKFNHRDKRYGKNFTTIEIGKIKIKDYISEQIGRDNLILFKGIETQNIRQKKGLKKTSDKSKEHFYTHCVDSYAIASELIDGQEVLSEDIIVVDDTYRPTRRRLHDTQPSKGGRRDKYSTGNFKGIRKGSICEFGQVVGGTGNSVFIRNSDNKRIGKSINKINWFSKGFKVKTKLEDSKVAIPPTTKVVGILAPIL